MNHPLARHLEYPSLFAAILLAAAPLMAPAQGSGLEHVRQLLNLPPEEVARLRQGSSIVRELATPDKAEILVYGAVHIRSSPEAFVSSYTDVEKLTDGKNYLSVKKFSSPPRASDFAGLALDAKDLLELRVCRAGDCEIQMPEKRMEQFRTKVNWTAADAAMQAKKLVAEIALEAIAAYQKGGNKALGEYNDKKNPTRVEEAFRTVIGRPKQLEIYAPDFLRYLMDFPARGPDRTTDFYYWENVNFGLKPTFRINHVSIHRPAANPQGWMIANKQLYASHYFQTAIDISHCVPDGPASFYLLTLKGSRQDGLTGVKGRLVRPAVAAKAKESLTAALERLKERSELGR